MTIDQKTLAEILQLGGQYFLPVAALLRALYAGVRGRLPDGFRQITLAGIFAGIVAAVTGEPVDIRSAILAIFSNTVFTVGLLAFIILYLLRMRNRGLVVDGIIGGIIGLIVWLFTVYVLRQPWPWWFIPLLIAGGAAGFIALRFAMRQIARVMRWATTLIVIGLILVIGAGAFMLLQTVLQSAPAR